MQLVLDCYGPKGPV